jgi:hypothetical protein
LLLLGRQDRRRKESLHRRLGLIVGAPHFTALSFFRLEFHGGLKTIHIDPQRPLEFGELSRGEQALEAIRANHLPDNLPVFLLSIALIEARVEDALWKV